MSTADAANLVGGSAISLTTTDPFELAAVTITAPGKGLFLLLGTVTYDNLAGASSREIQTRLAQTSPPILSIVRDQYSRVGTAADATAQASVTIIDGRNVSAAGTFTFKLFAERANAGSGTPRAFNVSLTVIFLPFNGAGE